MIRLLTRPIVWCLYLASLPVAVLIALMDSNNGLPFRHNLDTVLGKTPEQKPKKNL